VIRSQSGIAPRIQQIADVKDDEFEGDEQAQKAMKGMLFIPCNSLKFRFLVDSKSTPVTLLAAS